MADVISKSSIFSPTISRHNHLSNVKNFPVQCSISTKNQGKLAGFPSLKSIFNGARTAVDQNHRICSQISRKSQSIDAKLGLSFNNAPKWWEKGLQPNMREVASAEDLVDSLLNAGDKLVVVDFFSPGCGGCKALHPKLCQLAEMNSDVQFLQVNYEEHKSMCYSLNVHVLPFFRFYRGSEGRLCSFSCTNATIKKFRDALAKHGTERCSIGPTKGLEEKELIALAANKDLSFTYTPKPVELEPVPELQEVSAKADTIAAVEESLSSSSNKNPHSSPSTLKSSRESEEKSLAAARR